MSDEFELLLCPHCGGEPIVLWTDGDRVCRVECTCCEVRGPAATVESKAVDGWNALPRKVETLPDAQLDALEELAGKATEGGWCYEEAFGGQANHWAFIVRRDIDEPGFYSAIAEMVGEERTEEDAAFIAAANPAVVLALIAEVRHGRVNDD